MHDLNCMASAIAKKSPQSLLVYCNISAYGSLLDFKKKRIRNDTFL